jgi:hypothetical protein
MKASKQSDLFKPAVASKTALNRDKPVGSMLCDDCSNYHRCKSFWRGSVNSLNCNIEYGLFESKQGEAENE